MYECSNARLWIELPIWFLALLLQLFGQIFMSSWCLPSSGVRFAALFRCASEIRALVRASLRASGLRLRRALSLVSSFSAVVSSERTLPAVSWVGDACCCVSSWWAARVRAPLPKASTRGILQWSALFRSADPNLRTEITFLSMLTASRQHTRRPRSTGLS